MAEPRRCQGAAAAFDSIIVPAPAAVCAGRGTLSDRCATGRRRRPRGPWRRGRACAAWSAGMASLACSPNDPSPMAASWRMSSVLVLERFDQRRHDLGRVPLSLRQEANRDDPVVLLGFRRLQIRDQLVGRFRLAAAAARQQAKQQNKTVAARAWLNSLIGRGRSPIAEHFAAGDGAEVLIRVGVDAAGEEMHRAVAEQEVRPAPGACSKTYRGRRTGCRRWAGAWRCRGRGPGLRRSPHCRRRSVAGIGAGGGV